MKRIIVLTLSLIVIACMPQTTESPTATLASPTQKPISTPTLNPAFIELQNLIVDSSENLILLPNGQIAEDGVTIPNLQVEPNGEIMILIEGESIVVDAADITFEAGLVINGYELQDGEWIEAMSEAELSITTILKDNNIERDSVTLSVNERGIVTATDNETGKVVLQANEFQTWYDINLAVEIAAKSCEQTPFKPDSYGRIQGKDGQTAADYVTALKNDLDYYNNGSKRANTYNILLSREEQCWAFSNGVDLLYRDEEGIAQKITIIALTQKEIFEFAMSKR